MVAGKPSLARLEPAEGGHVDACMTRHVLERQPALDPQFAQPAPNSQVNIVLNSHVCLHGKLYWQIKVRAASWRHERNEGALGRALRRTRSVLEWSRQCPIRRHSGQSAAGAGARPRLR